MDVRAKLFSEARFQFRQIRNGRPGDLFGTADLQMLEVPWTNGTTGDLLYRMIQSADLAGNAFVARRPQGVRFSVLTGLTLSRRRRIATRRRGMSMPR